MTRCDVKTALLEKSEKKFNSSSSADRRRHPTEVNWTSRRAAPTLAYYDRLVSDIAIFVLKRDVKLHLTNYDRPLYGFSES